MTRPPPTSTLFPYTTLFRSQVERGLALLEGLGDEAREGARRDVAVLRRRQRLALVLEGLRGRLAPASAMIAARRERSEEHTSELQSLRHLVCRLLLEKKKNT